MNLNRKTTNPLDVPRTMRRHGVRGMTSMPAGKMVPLAATVLHREDALRSGSVQFSVEMAETAELLMNAVYINYKAYLVPWLAFERFDGSLDQFNRSYNGQPSIDGGATVPFFSTHAIGSWGSKPIYKYLGLHAKPTANVNTMYAEAYNAIWNFRALNRSKSITKRTATDTSLAPAFWNHTQFDHIVPDFDQAVIDGQVALNVVQAKLPVKGIGVTNNPGTTGTVTGVKESGGTTSSWTAPWYASEAATARVYVKQSGTTAFPDVFAELAQNGITVSLSNIEMAKKTQAFARLREQYVGFDDAWIIDMLMDGLSIPDQALKQPILLAESQNVFGQNKRYSTDATALTKSAVNGMSMGQMSIRVPKLMTGGVVMIVAEVVPEQLFERQKDPYFHMTAVSELPAFMRDNLDPEKVDVVTNDRIDIDHATPAGVFGYEPMNAKFDRMTYNIGGKFHRPQSNTSTDDVRQRLWSVETVNPSLSADWYLTTTMHQKPFLDTLADPFEVVTIADFAIEGNTVFGGQLVEAMANYAAVSAKQPTTRITKP